MPVPLNNIPTNWSINFQNPASTAMEKIIDLHNDIMLFIIFIMVFISWMLVRTVYLFRSTNKKTIRFSFQHHTKLEQVWTVMPALILLLIASPSFSLLYTMDELRDPKLTVHCKGNQWYWVYEYSDFARGKGLHGETIKFSSYMVTEENLKPGQLRLLEVDNILHLPLRQEIRLLISSLDVIHSWAVPALGVKMDGIPGRLNQIALYITRHGQYYGQCSELCGVNHSFMPIVVKAETHKDFTAWITSL